SELLYNHKALLFSRDKNLLAFPVSLAEVKGGEAQGGMPAYGEFTYQGAYVYNVDLANGFALKGRISHLSDQDYLMAGNHWYHSDKNVSRILYVDDVLYTLSGKYIKANSLDSLAEIGTLEIK
ncbi:MAG: beta-propeller domain-containing protein, partial [Desulfotomaculaceae bacterium]|nr:beta-propeller domain-containing protein [Desulfotomaculaceae bacterium]